MSTSPKGALTRAQKGKLGQTAFSIQTQIASAPRGSPLKAASLQKELDAAQSVLKDTAEDDTYEGIHTIRQMHDSLTNTIKTTIAAAKKWDAQQQSDMEDSQEEEADTPDEQDTMDMTALLDLNKKVSAPNIKIDFQLGEGKTRQITLETYEQLASNQHENVNYPTQERLKRANDYCIKTTLDPTTHVTNIVKEIDKYITDPIYKKLWELSLRPTEDYLRFAMTEYVANNNQYVINLGAIRRYQTDLANMVHTLASVTGKPQNTLQRILAHAPKANLKKNNSALNNPVHDVLAAFIDHTNQLKAGNARRADCVRKAELNTFTIDTYKPKQRELLLHDYLEDLQRIADGINTEGPDENGETIITEQYLWEHAAAQLVSMRVRTTSQAYAREIENLIRRVTKMLDKRERDNLTATEKYKVGTLDGLRAEAHNAYATASHRDGKNNDSTEPKQSYNYTKALQTPVNVVPPTKDKEQRPLRERAPKAHTGAKAETLTPRTHPPAERAPSAKNHGQGGTKFHKTKDPGDLDTGRQCNMCPNRHRDFRKCTLHYNNMKEAGYSSPFCGNKNADGVYDCLICGSKDHITAQCSEKAIWGPFVGRCHPEAERLYEKYTKYGIPFKPKTGALARLELPKRQSSNRSRRRATHSDDEEEDQTPDSDPESDNYDDGSVASEDNPHSGALGATCVGGLAACLAGMEDGPVSSSRERKNK